MKMPYGVLAFGALMTLTAPAYASATGFTDIGSLDAQTQSAINDLVSKGIVAGTDSATFSPNSSVTRAQFAKLIDLARGISPTNSTVSKYFGDIPSSDSWAVGYIDAAKEAGVFDGTGPNSFSPDETVTREQAAKVLVTSLGKTADATPNIPFTDVSDIDDWAKGYVSAANSMGLIKGYPDGTFEPHVELPRWQAALLVERFISMNNLPTITTIHTTVSGTHMTVFGAAKNADHVEIQIDQGTPIQVNLNADGTYAYTTVSALKPGNHSVTVVAYMGTTGSTPSSAPVTIEDNSGSGGAGGSGGSGGGFGGSGGSGGTIYTPPNGSNYASVSNISAKQVQINFGRSVNDAIASNPSHYAIQIGPNVTQLSSSNVSVTMNATDTAATLTFVNPLNTAPWNLTTGTGFNVNFSNIIDSNGYPIPDASTPVVYSDTVAPTVSSINAIARTTTNKVTLTFNKAVDISTAQFQVNGTLVANASQDLNDPNTIDLTTTQYLGAGQSYPLTITNVQDYSGNMINPNPSTRTISVVGDTVNQGLSSVTTTSDNQINVQFAEKMDPATVKTGNIKILDANAEDVSTADGEIVNIAPIAGDKTGTKYKITLTGTGIYDNTGKANLQVVFTNSITDMAGNPFTSVTRSVQLIKNTVVPTIQSTSYVRPGLNYNGIVYTNGAIVLKFNENIKTPTKNQLAASYLVAVDQNGNNLTANFGSPVSGVVNNTNDGSIIVLPLQVALPSTTANLTLQVQNGAFTDTSNGANQNQTWTGVVSISTATSSPGYTNDTTKPVIVAGSVTGSESTDTITYHITEADLDNTSATNISNYLLDGHALPIGSYVTVSTVGTDNTVQVNLPPYSVTTTGATHAFTINNIRDLSGNVAASYGVANVDLKDNSAPVLTSATFNSDGTLALNFGEAMNSSSSYIAKSDFKIYVNNGTALPTSDYTITYVQTGADAGQLLVTFTNPSDAPASGNTVKIATIPSPTTTADADGIIVAGNKNVTVTR